MKLVKYTVIAGVALLALYLLGKLLEALLYGLQYVAVLIIPLTIGGAVLWAIWFFATLGQRRSKMREAEKSKSLETLMAQFGESREARADGINRAFDERSGTVSFSLVYIGKGLNQRIACNMERSLATMPPQEREALRSALLLRAAGRHVSDNNTWIQVLGIIYGDGKATIFSPWFYTWPGFDTGNINEGVEWVIGADKAGPSVNLAMVELGKAAKKFPDDPVIGGLSARLLGTGGDIKEPTVLIPIDPASPPPNALILGGSGEGGGDLLGYAGEGHLITIAPSRSGKSQCHVVPNLLTWDGPAFVLDVKNELHAMTSGWRAANVGPVFKFSPLTPDHSHRYNPISEVSRDPDHLWEDARFLADMLVVPGGKDVFWEHKARDLIAAAIAYVVYHNEPEDRSIEKVLEAINPGEWERFIAGLAAADDISTMTRASKSLGEMEERMRDSVRQTALAHLSTWEGNRIRRSTAVSDWRPEDLRNGSNPTVYICLRPNEVDSYISMLRVMIAQHIRKLTGELPPRDTKPILFVLDELPRLRTMKPVEEALDIGAQYGLKIWMFAQTMSQMENAYERADGMVGGCAVRCFMNPSMQDGLAQKLSDQLGFRDSVLDGSRQKLVEPTVLAGPEFRDTVIVMASSAKPGFLKKRPAFREPVLVPRTEMMAVDRTTAS